MKWILILLFILASFCYATSDFDLEEYIINLQKAKEAFEKLDGFYFFWNRSKNTRETFNDNTEPSVIEIDSGELKWHNFV